MSEKSTPRKAHENLKAADTVTKFVGHNLSFGTWMNQKIGSAAPSIGMSPEAHMLAAGRYEHVSKFLKVGSALGPAASIAHAIDTGQRLDALNLPPHQLQSAEKIIGAFRQVDILQNILSFSPARLAMFGVDALSLATTDAPGVIDFFFKDLNPSAHVSVTGMEIFSSFATRNNPDAGFELFEEYVDLSSWDTVGLLSSDSEARLAEIHAQLEQQALDITTDKDAAFFQDRMAYFTSAIDANQEPVMLAGYPRDHEAFNQVQEQYQVYLQEHAASQGDSDAAPSPPDTANTVTEELQPAGAANTPAAEHLQDGSPDSGPASGELPDSVESTELGAASELPLQDGISGELQPDIRSCFPDPSFDLSFPSAETLAALALYDSLRHIDTPLAESSPLPESPADGGALAAQPGEAPLDEGGTSEGITLEAESGLADQSLVEALESGEPIQPDTDPHDSDDAELDAELQDQDADAQDPDDAELDAELQDQGPELQDPDEASIQKEVEPELEEVVEPEDNVDTEAEVLGDCTIDAKVDDFEATDTPEPLPDFPDAVAEPAEMNHGPELPESPPQWEEVEPAPAAEVTYPCQAEHDDAPGLWEEVPDTRSTLFDPPEETSSLYVPPEDTSSLYGPLDSAETVEVEVNIINGPVETPAEPAEVEPQPEVVESTGAAECSVDFDFGFF